MGDFLISVLAWSFHLVLFAGLVVFVIWTIRHFGALFTSRERLKVYYDDNDHSKGYYYVNKPGGRYPVGYPKEKIVKDMKAFERLKREQKTKRIGRRADGAELSPNKPRSMWLQILLMTPAEYTQYRRRKKEAKQR